MMFRVEMRNNITSGGFEVRDVLDTITNSATGVDLFGHQGLQSIGQPTSRHMIGIFKSFKYTSGQWLTSTTITSNYQGNYIPFFKIYSV